MTVTALERWGEKERKDFLCFGKAYLSDIPKVTVSLVLNITHIVNFAFRKK